MICHNDTFDKDFNEFQSNDNMSERHCLFAMLNNLMNSMRWMQICATPMEIFVSAENKYENLQLFVNWS